MEPNLTYIRQLVRDRDWTGSELARQMGISRSEANRFLNGQRKGGNKVISGLLRVFPEETMETLFFTPLYPNSNTITDNVTDKKCDVSESPSSPLERDKPQFLKPVKHPSSRQNACKIDEKTGTIEIAEGANITTLLVPPGPIEVRHTKKFLSDTS